MTTLEVVYHLIVPLALVGSVLPLIDVREDQQ